MRLIQLRYVKSVASTGCFSASARAFGVSQPTVSNAISDLEEELHARLFRRTTRSVELTAFGTCIVGYVNEIIGLVEEIEQQGERHARPGKKLLLVGFSPIVDGPRLFRIFDAFRAKRRGAEFIYRECPEAELESRLGEEKLDVVCGIRLRETPAFAHCTLYTEPLRFLPRGGLAEGSIAAAVTLESVAQQLLVLPADNCGLASAIRAQLQGQGLLAREYPGRPLSYNVMQEWALEGIGAAILPESRISGDPTQYPLITGADGHPLTVAVEAVWVRGGRDALVKEFVGYLRENAATVMSSQGPIHGAYAELAPTYRHSQSIIDSTGL